MVKRGAEVSAQCNVIVVKAATSHMERVYNARILDHTNPFLGQKQAKT